MSKKICKDCGKIKKVNNEKLCEDCKSTRVIEAAGERIAAYIIDSAKNYLIQFMPLWAARTIAVGGVFVIILCLLFVVNS